MNGGQRKRRHEWQLQGAVLGVHGGWSGAQGSSRACRAPRHWRRAEPAAPTFAGGPAVAAGGDGQDGFAHIRTCHVCSRVSRLLRYVKCNLDCRKPTPRSPGRCRGPRPSRWRPCLPGACWRPWPLLGQCVFSRAGLCVRRRCPADAVMDSPRGVCTCVEVSVLGQGCEALAS